MKLTAQVTNELAEVDALLRREVAHDLAAAKEVLDADGLHVELRLVHERAEGGERVLAPLGKHLRAREVGIGRNALDGLELAALADDLAQVLFAHLARVHRGKADLLAALRRADQVVALLGASVPGVKPQVMSSIFELHRDDGGHASASLTERSMTSRVSCGDTFLVRL